MATEINPDQQLIFEIVPGPQIDVTVGFEGPPGTSAIQISNEVGNQLEAKPDGLYVPSPLASTQW